MYLDGGFTFQTSPLTSTDPNSAAMLQGPPAHDAPSQHVSEALEPQERGRPLWIHDIGGYS